jgi:hypothetical protein
MEARLMDSIIIGRGKNRYSFHDSGMIRKFEKKFERLAFNTK